MGMADKKTLGVVTTNLTMRFYRKDGWTEELLRELVVRQQFEGEPFRFFDDQIDGHDMAYWIPEVGTFLDVDRLLADEGFKDFSIKVNRTFDDHPEETDLEHLRKKNW